MNTDRNIELCEAAWEGDADRVRELIVLGADIECYDDNGNTPLHLAVEQLWYDVVRVLLESGANVDHRDRLGEWTPLIHAAEICSVAARQVSNPPGNSTIQLLLEYGADVNQRSSRGKTALMYARQYVNHDAEAILLAAGARE